MEQYITSQELFAILNDKEREVIVHVGLGFGEEDDADERRKAESERKLRD